MASGLERFDEAVVMTRIMFPYIGFISLVSLSAGVLNTWKRFAVPAATPVLLNLAHDLRRSGCSSPVFARAGIERIYALAAGVMLGGVLQLARPGAGALAASARCRASRLGAAHLRRGLAPPGRAQSSCARWRRRCSASRSRSSRC